MTERRAPRPRSPSPSFPGSNDDRDTQLALERLGADATRVWHAEDELPAATAAVVLPGGFSYGDYLRCGAIARFSPIMARRRRGSPARAGSCSAICNGFQILTEAGLLPGVAPAERVADLHLPRRRARRSSGRTRRSRRAARRARRSRSRSRTARAAGSPTRSCSRSSRPNGQILLRYAPGREPERRGRPTSPASATRPGNVFGLMPHPEHAVDPLLGSDRRRAAARLARRRCSVVDRGARLGLASRSPGSPANRAPPPAPSPAASAARSRSRSFGRSVTGPRRATPSVV